jgi:hypothetical protein
MLSTRAVVGVIEGGAASVGPMMPIATMDKCRHRLINLAIHGWA